MPAGHNEHALLFRRALWEPAGQLLHLDATLFGAVPGVHAMQDAVDPGETQPGSQALQVVAAGDGCVPSGHARQSASEDALTKPGGHAEH